jgi:hypothetical protein
MTCLTFSIKNLNLKQIEIKKEKEKGSVQTFPCFICCAAAAALTGELHFEKAFFAISGLHYKHVMRVIYNCSENG